MGHYDYDYKTLSKKEIKKSIESMEQTLKKYKSNLADYREDYKNVKSPLLKSDIEDRIHQVQRDIKETQNNIAKYKEGLEGKREIEVVIWT